MYREVNFSQKDIWDEIVNSFNNVDIYFRWGYIKPFSDNRDGEPILFYYEDDNGRALIKKDNNYLFYYANLSGTSYTVPSHVKGLGSRAFANCDNLAEIIIPEGVEIVSTSAFANTNLTSINLPTTITSIGIRAFDNCLGLTELTIPENVETIYSTFILGCSNLEKITFSKDQQNALDSINLSSEDTYLLHGVTGSGKTEVYIELIKRVVSLGKKAIMLVPEISLTAQIVNKFYDHFGNDVAIFHSGLSNGEKYDEYLKILRDEVHIVVGTRSAIFTPLTNLGLIIIDEEHSETYKQDSTPRYHSLDMATFRSKYNHIPIVLGSATPSLESMARALKGVYKYIEMPNRVGKAILPKIEIIDMANEMKKRNMIFSSTLKNKIQDRLLKKEQVILLLNRRGYTTVMNCHDCGYTYKCPNCDIPLTYHKGINKMKCHYCNLESIFLLLHSGQ